MSGNQPDTIGADGILNDDVSSYPADQQKMRTYANAREKLSQFQAPVLVHAGNPHERLYVACFDGTGNDAVKDPAHATNVAGIYDQIYKLEKAGHPQISGGYVPGPGTQDGWFEKTRDGITGGTYDQRIEEMYAKFIKQAKAWRDADPDAQIRLADIGFSRGSEQAAGFARLVHERGIQDHTGAVYERDSNNMITSVHYTKPPLVSPGQVPQVEGLFDAVGTGEPYQHDRRPPPSVVSGLHIMAMDERRSAFPSDRIIDPGLTSDGRLLGLEVAGAHSDVGGSYLRNGLAIRSGNLMTDYLNALGDKPFLQKGIEPNEQRLNQIHRSEEASPYNLMPQTALGQPRSSNKRLVSEQVEYEPIPFGEGAVRERRSERPGVQDPFNAEPRDELLNSQFKHRPVGDADAGSDNAPMPKADPSPSSPGSPKASPLMHPDLRAIFESNGDPAVMAQSAQNYLNSPSGQLFEMQGQAAAARLQQGQGAPEQPQQAEAPRVQQEGLSMSR